MGSDIVYNFRHQPSSMTTPFQRFHEKLFGNDIRHYLKNINNFLHFKRQDAINPAINLSWRKFLVLINSSYRYDI